MKKLLLLTLSLFVGLGIAFAFTYEWVIDDMEYANDAAAQAAYVSSAAKATGGTITYDGAYVIHTFLSDGIFTPASAFDVETIVIAGGGGGGKYAIDNNYGGGGGGGAGGYLGDASLPVTAQAYSITVGDGGAGRASTDGVGTNGGDSVFSTLTAKGGGGGGGSGNGVVGGSGGGGGSGGNGAAGTASQGYAGGNGYYKSAICGAGGGGGGSSAVGVVAHSCIEGAGGAGTASSISGSGVTRAAGGDGMTGVTSEQSTPSAGVANSGDGGGGADGTDGADGGSGIVIIKYLVVLQSYSESTIKQQGSYSLKGIAVITDSLNDTLTRTLADNLDLSNSEGIEYDIYALRTGSNIKIGLHDSGGTTTEHTANVASSNTNQTESWDISGVSDANKDDIDSIIITIMNADAANTFYLDDIKWGVNAGGSWTFVN